MSTQVLDRVSDLQDKILDVVESVKEPVSSAIETVVEFVNGRVDVPAIPYAEQIPTPKEIIDNQSRFATKLVSTNKSVALSAAKAASPLTDKLLDRKAAPARKAPAAKASA